MKYLLILLLIIEPLKIFADDDALELARQARVRQALRTQARISEALLRGQHTSLLAFLDALNEEEQFNLNLCQARLDNGQTQNLILNQVDQSRLCRPESNCNYYQCIADKYQCGPNDFITNFPTSVCPTFMSNIETGGIHTEAGITWLMTVPFCLQMALMDHCDTSYCIGKTPEEACTKIEEVVIEKHTECFFQQEVSLCDLPPDEMLAVAASIGPYLPTFAQDTHHGYTSRARHHGRREGGGVESWKVRSLVDHILPCLSQYDGPLAVQLNMALTEDNINAFLERYSHTNVGIYLDIVNENFVRNVDPEFVANDQDYTRVVSRLESLIYLVEHVPDNIERTVSQARTVVNVAETGVRVQVDNVRREVRDIAVSTTLQEAPTVVRVVGYLRSLYPF